MTEIKKKILVPRENEMGAANAAEKQVGQVTVVLNVTFDVLCEKLLLSKYISRGSFRVYVTKRPEVGDIPLYKYVVFILDNRVQILTS